MGVMAASGKGGAPAPPDFTSAAEQQAQSGHISTPFASWGAGNSLQFSGGLDQGAQNLMGQIGSQGALPTGQEARDQAITGAYNQATSRLDPQFAQREEALRSQLMNQGLDMSGRAATTELGNFERGRNDAYSQAMANAIGQGTSAGNAIFQQGVQGQNQPYNQLSSLAGLLGGNQGQQTQYLNAANMGYQGDLNAYGVDQANKNSTLNGLMNLGGMAAMGASDERLKKEIVRSTMEAIPGVPFASWEWIDGPPGRYVGVIAQDLEKIRPEMVHTGPDGMKLVNYGFLDEVNHG